MKVSQNSEQNNSDTHTNENQKEIPKERFVSPEERQYIIDKIRSKLYNDAIKNIRGNC